MSRRVTGVGEGGKGRVSEAGQLHISFQAWPTDSPVNARSKL